LASYHCPELVFPFLFLLLPFLFPRLGRLLLAFCSWLARTLGPAEALALRSWEIVAMETPMAKKEGQN
jgi:hypothetical protein